jgi:hypothetical protein
LPTSKPFCFGRCIIAKKRYINTVFWNDNYISNLDPSEKLLFIYLITNPFTNISGIYQIPLKTVANDTGIDKEMVIKIINRFQNDNKILYVDGWIAVRNFIKHQGFSNPSVLMSIEREIENKPIELVKFIDTVCIQSVCKLPKLASKSKSKSKSKSFIAPSLEKINEYITERKLTVDGKQFFEYFTEGNWIDSEGKKVINWKQKLLTWNSHGNRKKDERAESDKRVKKLLNLE